MPQGLRKMGGRYHRIKSFIKKIQRSPEAVKKRWLVICSAVSIILILTLWFFYLNLLLPSIATKEKQTAARPAGDREDFIDTMSRGFQKMKNDFTGRWSKLREGLDKNIGIIKNRLETKQEVIVPDKLKYSPPPTESTASTLIH